MTVSLCISHAHHRKFLISGLCKFLVVAYAATGYLFPNVTNEHRNDFAKGSYRWLSCGAVTNATGKGNLYLGHFYWKTSSYSSGVDAGLNGGSGVNGWVKTQNSSYPWCAYAIRCVKE